MRKYNKQLLLNEEAMNNIHKAKDMLSAVSNRRFSSSEIINEIIGKYVRFNALENDIKSYITHFSDALSKDKSVYGVLLFGSVARGVFGKYSDIDVLVVVKSDKMKSFDTANDVKMGLEPEREGFTKRGYHLRISTTILEIGDLELFRPIFLDFLEYGIIMYEKNATLTDFMNKLRRIKYQRNFDRNGEILRWKIPQVER